VIQERGIKDLKYKYFYAILNIGILVVIVLMTLSQVKKSNIVNKKLTLSNNYYGADGAVRLLESIALMTLLEVK
jgi:hypothetical protein